MEEFEKKSEEKILAPNQLENIEISSAPTDNVRNRVSTWLSSIVDEVRRKSPVPLQKWVESPQTIKTSDEETSVVSSNINPSKDKLEENCNSEIDEKFKILEDRKTESLQDNYDRNDQIKFWNRFSFDRTQLVSSTSGSDNNESNRVSKLKSLGKTKINELYEKVRLNRERYSQIERSKKMEELFDETHEEIPSELSAGSDSDEISQSQSKSNNELHDQINNANNESQDINDELENNLNISVNDSFAFKKFQRNLKLGDLGRSSTLNPKFLSDYEPLKPLPIQVVEETVPDMCILSSTPNTKSDRYLTFGGMCRSFSEQQHDTIDEVDENYLLNERSRSVQHVIEGETSSINENDAKNNNPDSCNVDETDDNNSEKDQVSTSLPTFSSSMHRSPISKNLTHRYSTSSICADASSTGSASGGFGDSYNHRRKGILLRDNSYHSDSSHCSSVDSLLESRKPDPETILINLGFGPIDSEDILSRIPKRFLKPSQVRGIDTEEFLKRQKLANTIHDHSVLGYRGLIGNPDLPPSVIVAKIMQRFEQNERNRSNNYDIDMSRPQSAPPNSMQVQKFNYNS